MQSSHMQANYVRTAPQHVVGAHIAKAAVAPPSLLRNANLVKPQWRPRLPATTTAAAGYEPMAAPDEIFPDAAWSWQKAPPKESLKQLPVPQDGHADAITLNFIEAIHWFSFPLGFGIVWYIFSQQGSIAPFVGYDPNRVFLIMLGLLSQIFGGGIAGNMMHEYEGWQVAPFRNPLALPTTPPQSDVDQLRVPKYNNAWLRAVAYQMLFTFQTFGLGCFTMAVYGFNIGTIGLLVCSSLIALAGPHEPRLNLTYGPDKHPILPLSVSLLVVFAINALINLTAYHTLFFEPILQAWPPHLLPALGLLPKWLTEAIVHVVAILPPVLVGAGGAVEGYFAEGTFDQRLHAVAFIILLLGLGVHGAFYWHLAHTPLL